MSFGRQRYQGGSRSEGRSRGGTKLRLMIAGAIGLISLVSFMCQSQQNPITGENQRVSLTPRQEVMLGLEAAPKHDEATRRLASRSSRPRSRRYGWIATARCLGRALGGRGERVAGRLSV